MNELLGLLSNQLFFFLDPHGYSIVASQGVATGNAYLDLKRGSLIWRLTRDKMQVSLDLRFEGGRDDVSYSTAILKRWVSGTRDDSAALLTPDVARWVRAHLEEIEAAVAGELRMDTVRAWTALQRLSTKELFG